MKVKSLSRVQLFAAPWTVAYQAPPSMDFSRQEYWTGLPFPSPGDLPDPGIEPRSSAFQADNLTSEPPGKFLCLLFHLMLKIFFEARSLIILILGIRKLSLRETKSFSQSGTAKK